MRSVLTSPSLTLFTSYYPPIDFLRCSSNGNLLSSRLPSFIFIQFTRENFGYYANIQNLLNSGIIILGYFYMGGEIYVVVTSIVTSGIYRVKIRREKALGE